MRRGQEERWEGEKAQWIRQRRGKGGESMGGKPLVFSYAEAVAIRVYLTSRTIMHSRYD